MLKLPGYRVDELIYEGLRTRVYRGWSEGLQGPVCVKLHRSPAPSEQQLATFERAYALGRELTCPGVIDHLALERYHRRLALVTEDYGAIALSEVLRQPLPLERRLRIAAALARALADLHDAGVVHRDIKPHNVVVHPWDDRVKLIDLGISSRLARENPAPAAVRQLEGTLAYISPEQTGRMNRSVDSRTDLYSLGVTLFELMTGRLPFLASDPMELIHCHLARRPPDPRDVRPDLPAEVVQVVLKLLAKAAEERYQSAHGLARDLELCLEAATVRQPLLDFRPGRHDVPLRLQVPQRLYGREREQALLLERFRAAATGSLELALVSGYSGVGKSALVHEVHRPILERRGAFCAGKFDQFRRDLPYSALVDALRDLVRQVLAEPRPRVDAVAARLAAGLGGNAGVIAEVIPELVHLVGRPAPPPDLPPIEAQNRFNQAFQAFLRAFALPEHPLVVFVDDLQWADLPSLQLLEVLATDADARAVLIVGAYRENEVDADHPLVETARRVQAAGGPVTQISLQPLDEPEVAQLLGDTFARPPAEVGELARLVCAKTRGNPFFLIEFLQELDQRGLVRFDAGAGRWRWEIDRIRAADITDNVIDLMAAKVRELPPPTLRALEVAACIGATFDIRALARVLERDRREAAQRLAPALDAGLLVPLDDSYKYVEALEGGFNPRYRFLHDRVQQATHDLLSAEARARLHLEIGRHLLASGAADDLGDELIEVVNHLDLGAELMLDPAERLSVARLNLAAARRAKASLAFEPARRYARAGLELLPQRAWRLHYPLALALHTELAEVSYLAADFEGMERLAVVVLRHARRPLDRVPITMIQIRAGVAQAEYGRAVDVALAALRELGVSLPRDPSRIAVARAFARFKLSLRGRDPRRLADLPEMTDPRVRAAMGILVSCGTSAYYAAQNLMALIAFEMLRLALRYGNCEEAAYGYGLLGMVVSGALGDIDTGYAFGKVASEVIDRYPPAEFHGKTKLFFDGFIRHWKDGLQVPAEVLLEDRRVALAQGDLENSVYCGVVSLYSAILAGQPLDAITDRYEPVVRHMRGSKQEQTVPIVDTWAQLVTTLASADGRGRLEGERVEAESMLGRLTAQQNYNALFHTAFADGLLALLFGELDRALQRFALAERHRDAVVGQAVLPALACAFGMALARRAATASGADAAALLARQAVQDVRLRRYARHWPGGNRHRLDLCVAERDWALGRRSRAEAGFRRALRRARQHGCLWEEALAAERLGELYGSGDAEDLAEHYAGVAYALYRRWGARAKLRQLESRWGHLVAGSEPRVYAPLAADSALTRETWHEADGGEGTLGGLLDLSAVLKAGQAITAEVELERVLAKLIEIALESAGAERGVFVSNRDGALWVEAAGAAGDRGVQVSLQEPLTDDGRCSPAVVEYVARTQRPVVLDDARQETRFVACGYLTRRAPRAVLCCPVVKQGQLVGAIYLENGAAAGAFSPDRLQVLEILASEVATAVENARLYEELRDKNEALEAALAKVELLEQAKQHLSKFVPRLVQERIEENPAQPGLDRSEREVSVLFLDIAGYTRMSEAVEPARLSLLLERYFSSFLDDIHRNQGDINETAGDGLMILFQASEGEDHAIRAVRTARAIREKSHQANAALRRAQDDEVAPIVVNMGLNSGAALVGSVRYEGVLGTRWTYTATGQVTNVAARVAAQATEGQILMTEATALRVGDHQPLERIGRRRLKNVSGEVLVYRLREEEDGRRGG